MAVRLKPCFGCPIPKTGNAECLSLRSQMRARVNGLGLRSAAFNCPVLISACAPGTRVVIPQKFMVEGHGFMEAPEWDVASEDVPATILTVTPDGFSAVVDKAAFDEIRDMALETSFKDPERARFRKRMPFSRIRSFLDEPRRTICEMGNAKDADSKCDSTECWCNQFKELS